MVLEVETGRDLLKNSFQLGAKELWRDSKRCGFGLVEVTFSVTK